MEMSQEKMEQLALVRFVERMADMLVECESVDPDTDRNVLCTHVAKVLDEAYDHGIRSERLMGMYVILRLSDQVDPFSVPEYAAVLQDPEMEEADKAHLLHMIRIGEL